VNSISEIANLSSDLAAVQAQSEIATRVLKMAQNNQSQVAAELLSTAQENLEQIVGDFTDSLGSSFDAYA